MAICHEVLCLVGYICYEGYSKDGYKGVTMTASVNGAIPNYGYVSLMSTTSLICGSDDPSGVPEIWTGSCPSRQCVKEKEKKEKKKIKR